MHQSKGTLRYSPKLTGERDEKWWLILDCDPGIGAYYRNLYKMWHYNCKKLQAPSWAEHITVVRNEEPPIKKPWQLHDKKQVNFTYTVDYFGSDGVYVWLDVECEELLDIREALGLPRNPIYPLHLTIGNVLV
jgi:hypothetical protein